MQPAGRVGSPEGHDRRSGRMAVFRSAVAHWGLILALTAVYVAAGKLGLRLASVHASATAVWPPSGIALAAFLLFGTRVWPAVALGAFLVNVTTAGSVATSIGIGAGNTLEGLFNTWLVNRFAHGRYAFERTRDIFMFTVAVVPGAVVSATVGVASLVIAGYVQWTAVGPIWMTWSLGDVTGALIVAPPVLLWADRRSSLLLRRPLEAACLLGFRLSVACPNRSPFSRHRAIMSAETSQPSTSRVIAWRPWSKASALMRNPGSSMRALSRRVSPPAREDRLIPGFARCWIFSKILPS